MAPVQKPAAGKKTAASSAVVNGIGKSSPAQAKGVAKEKLPKAKLIRDGFTIPESEFRVLSDLKMRAIGLKRPAKKSEVVRAGIMALSKMTDRSFLLALAAVPPLKTGRPKS